MIMEENIEELQRYVPNVHFEQIPIAFKNTTE